MHLTFFCEIFLKWHKVFFIQKQCFFEFIFNTSDRNRLGEFPVIRKLTRC